MPSPDGNIEIRWQTKTDGQDTVRFPVEVFFVQHLQSANPAPPSRRSVPVQTSTESQLRQLVVESELSPELLDLPFSLYAAGDPKALFEGSLQAVYPATEPATSSEPDDEDDGGDDPPQLWVRHLTYRYGEVPSHQLSPEVETEEG